MMVFWYSSAGNFFVFDSLPVLPLPGFSSLLIIYDKFKITTIDGPVFPGSDQPGWAPGATATGQS